VKTFYIGKNKKEASSYVYSETEKPFLISKKMLLMDTKKCKVFLVDGYYLNGKYKYPVDRKYEIFSDGVFTNTIFEQFSKGLLIMIKGYMQSPEER
jgi:hypothetical protein